MRAIIVTVPGGPDVLEIQERPDPHPRAGELLVEVHATALNRADLLQRRGLYPPPPGVTEIPGLECAGVVTQVGDAADDEWLGQRVMALLPGGGYAERVVIPAAMAMPVPEGTSLVEAAAIPEAFMTAREALFERGHLQPGETLLVHAGASGVGTAAVQLARCEGATVFATAGSAAKCALVERLGGYAINYRQQDFAAELERRCDGHGIDLIVDLVGSRYWPAHMRLLARRGRLVLVGLLGGNQPAEVDFAQLLRKEQSLLGMVLRSRSPSDKIAMTRRFVRSTLPLLEAGRVAPVVDEIFDFEGVAQAHAKMEDNENLGKIVLRLRAD